MSDYFSPHAHPSIESCPLCKESEGNGGKKNHHHHSRQEDYSQPTSPSHKCPICDDRKKEDRRVSISNCPHHGCPHHRCSYYECVSFNENQSPSEISKSDAPLYKDNSEDLLFPLRKTEAFQTLDSKIDATFHYLKHLTLKLDLFKNLEDDNHLKVLEERALDFRRRFTDVIILGTGGSSLGGKALYELKGNCAPRLHFLDNIDPHTFSQLFSRLNKDTTGVIAISKSGNTCETLMQLLVFIEQWQKEGHALSHHFLVISEPEENGIREIANHHHIPCLEHPPHIGGRFSVFSLVGLFPALIAGLDVYGFRKGALWVVDQLRTSEFPLQSACMRGSVLQTLLSQMGCTQTVLMPYIDRLSIFSSWYCQLWAESLGKNGKGTTPISALGTVDQHSQLQLYLDGPNDKLFTLITMAHNDVSLFKVHADHYTHSSVTILQQKTMGQLLMAEQQATIDTLTRCHAVTRTMTLPYLNESVMGALMMHFVLETLATAHLMGVNAFDQPAVEDGKILTRQYLSQMGS